MLLPGSGLASLLGLRKKLKKQIIFTIDGEIDEEFSG
jgi:hypothetical protein